MAKVFLDTNVLVYALDRHSRKKQREARRLLKTLEGEKQGVISTQVLQEFYVASTRKLGVDPMMVKSLLKAFENFETVMKTLSLKLARFADTPA
jgi:predicted nucleic acid-binding protein